MNRIPKRSIGTVAFNDNSFMPIAKVVHNTEDSLTSLENCVPNDKKNRWGFLIVGYEESKEIRASSDDETILKNIKSKYSPIIKSAIKGNAGKIGQSTFPHQNKLIFLEQSLVKSIGDLKSLLKSESYLCQSNELKESKPIALESRMYLNLSASDANSYLQMEHNRVHHTKKEELHKVHAYAFVGVPYTFNDDLELNEEAVFVSLMPKVQFEAGLFFDGTLNNLYNTTLRIDFEGYTQAQVFALKGLENDENIPTSGTIALLQNKPRKAVLDIIQEELKESITFFKNTQELDEKLKKYATDCASDSSEIIYNYLEDIRKSKSKKDVRTFVADELVTKGGSYSNAKSNIAILDELYDSTVKNQAHKGHIFRKNIYITGAGSYNPYLEKEHESDAVAGKALGMGETGVLAKVNQACKFVKESLSNTTYIDTLVFDVFGFSRGAAEARHFVNAIANKLDVKTRNNKKEFVLYKKDGSNLYPYLVKELDEKKDAIVIDKIIFRFVGIFDTVPHYGLFQNDDHEEDELDLKFDKNKISNVLHLTASDEYRANFALRNIEEVTGQFEERAFAGAHSDIGGGYIHNEKEEVLLYRANNLKGSFHKVQMQLKNKIIAWNKKYQWLEKTEIDINNSNSTDDGFKLFIYEDRFNTNEGEKRYFTKIKMKRTQISAEYSKIPLEYMHNKIKELNLPFKDLGSYKCTDSTLVSGSEKQKIFNNDINKIKQIRSGYFHHSSNLLGIGMDGNISTEKDEFYSKRIVYNSKRKK